MSFAALLHFGHLSRLSGYVAPWLELHPWLVPRCSGSPDKLLLLCGSSAVLWKCPLHGARAVHAEIQSWNFCEFPELVSVSCCLLFRWHAAFQALCVSELNKKLSLVCARSFAVVL